MNRLARSCHGLRAAKHCFDCALKHHEGLFEIVPEKWAMRAIEIAVLAEIVPELVMPPEKVEIAMVVFLLTLPPTRMPRPRIRRCSTCRMPPSAR